MSSGSKTVGVGRLGHDGKGYEGPTYADVRELAAEMEATFSGRVGFILDPEDASARWRFSRIWVRAWFSDFGGPWSSSYWAAISFGGNSGTKTLPAAMMGALLALWEQVDERNPSEEQAPRWGGGGK